MRMGNWCNDFRFAKFRERDLFMTPDHPPQDASATEASPFGDLAAHVEGDMELFAELAGVFLGECPQMMEAIRAAIEGRNPSEVEKAAHKFKGCVGVFTSRGPFAYALQLEMMGREKDLAAADETYRELENQVQAFTAEMIQFLARAGV